MNDGSLPHLRNFGVHNWLMPSFREATGSVIGEESLMMVLPIKEEPLQTVPGVMQLVPSKRKRRQRPWSSFNAVAKPRVQQQIWTVPLSQPMQAAQLMQPQVLLSQPAQQTHLVSVAQSQPLSQGCSSVTGETDTEEPPAQRRRCVEDLWSPSIEVKSEVNQSVNTVVSDTLDDLIPAVASDDLISQMLNSAVGETELDGQSSGQNSANSFLCDDVCELSASLSFDGIFDVDLLDLKTEQTSAGVPVRGNQQIWTDNDSDLLDFVVDAHTIWGC